jgi:hypothetical protein
MGGQARVAGAGLHDRDVLERGGRDPRANVLRRSGVDVGRKDLPRGPDFGCKCDGQLAAAGADVSHRHTRLERKLVPEPRHLGPAGTKAGATPVAAASAEEHGQKDDGRRARPEAHSQRRTEALYSRYSAPNRPVRYRSSRGTTTTAMMATVAINVATSHELLTKIARPRCNAKNAR